MEDLDECRICCEQGQYNIFNDELCFDTKDTNKLKIYIVLNNFLYEKLYLQDQHSSLICHTCCNSLCDSYTFMIGVRKAEQNWKFGSHKNVNKMQKSFLNAELKSPKTEVLESDGQTIQETVDETEEILMGEDVAVPDEVYESEDETYELKSVEETAPEMRKVENFQEIFVRPQTKRSRTSTGLPDSIVYTHYELAIRDESDQNVVVLNVTASVLMRPKEGNYEFDTSWIDQEADEITVYKCQYCIKAFSSVDFLLKHTLSSHLCLICLETVENYKELNKHSKVHASLKCHFCNKSCGSSSNFRQHLKKNHMLKIPNHVGILPDSLIVQ